MNLRSYLGLAAAALLASGMPGAPAASSTAAAPQVFLSMVGVAGRTIEAGEPLFVSVRLETPFESKERIELAPAAATWVDAVEVSLSGVGGMRRAEATFKPATPGTWLDSDQAALGEWLFRSSVTKDLTPGEYRLLVRLAIRDGQGWKGEVTAPAESVRVVAASADPERAAQRAVGLASEALLADALPEAARQLDRVLSAQPDHIELLTLRAVVCARAGDWRSAMVCVNRAMRTAQRLALHLPPLGLHEVREQVTRGLVEAGPEAPPPPAWTRLPPQVATISRGGSAKLAKDSGKVEPAPAAPPGAKAGPVAGVTTPGASPVVSAPVGTLVGGDELTESRILSDAAGQWSSAATADSSYSSPNYSASRATGSPNVPVAGDSVEAWCPGRQNDGTVWIELSFARPVRATEVRVRQTNLPGAIAKVEAVAADGTAHLWWEGRDEAGLAAGGVVWLGVRVPATTYPVAKVKLTLDLSRRPGWKQIDAVQLVAAP